MPNETTTTKTESEKQYRKRAETAELVLTEWPSRTAIKKAVYWPQEASYGGADICASIDDAKQRARETLKLGFGRDSKSVVHIIETTTRIIEVSIGSAESV
jgi:hypothetical protein